MNKKIVVVDDDEAILEVIKIVLLEAGFEVQTINEGAKAVSIVTENLPDLVIVDLWMSGIEGSEITKQLKSQPKTSKIPVVVVSAHNDTAMIARNCNADDFLPKPFDIDELVSKVRSLTEV